MAFLSQSAILPLFVSRNTPSPLALGLLTALYMLGSNLAQPFGAAHSARAERFFGCLRFHAFTPRVALFALAGVPFLPRPWSLVAFFAAFGAFSFTIGFQTPMWWEFVGHIIAPERRGAFLGIRYTLGSLACLAAAGGASWLLAVLPYPLGYACCFALGAVFAFVSYLCVMATRFDWPRADAVRLAQPPEPYRQAASTLLRQSPDFRQYLWARLALACSTLAAAFYVVHLQRRFGLSDAQSSLAAIALVYLPSIPGMLLGQLADRFGTKPVLVAGAFVGGLATLALMVSPDLVSEIVALFLVGCGTQVFAMLDGKWLIEIDADRRASAVSFFSLAMTAPTVAMALLAGPVAQRWGLGAVFAISAVAWLVGAVWLATGVRPAGLTTGRPSPAA